jgi:predicted  nucleic acid-binding Zn-ribbon protein
MTDDAQDQQTQIDALKAEVSALKERIANQEAALKKLRAETENALRQVQKFAPRPPLARM